MLDFLVGLRVIALFLTSTLETKSIELLWNRFLAVVRIHVYRGDAHNSCYPRAYKSRLFVEATMHRVLLLPARGSTRRRYITPSPYWLLNIFVLDACTACVRVLFVSLLSPLPCQRGHTWRSIGWKRFSFALTSKNVAPGFKNKTKYTLYVSLRSQISHIATNKNNIKWQCLNT